MCGRLVAIWELTMKSNVKITHIFCLLLVASFFSPWFVQSGEFFGEAFSTSFKGFNFLIGSKDNGWEPWGGLLGYWPLLAALSGLCALGMELLGKGSRRFFVIAGLFGLLSPIIYQLDVGGNPFEPDGVLAEFT